MYVADLLVQRRVQCVSAVSHHAAQLRGEAGQQVNAPTQEEMMGFESTGAVTDCAVHLFKQRGCEITAQQQEENQLHCSTAACFELIEAELIG